VLHPKNRLEQECVSCLRLRTLAVTALNLNTLCGTLNCHRSLDFMTADYREEKACLLKISTNPDFPAIRDIRLVRGRLWKSSAESAFTP
jgi:hypothetical protein